MIAKNTSFTQSCLACLNGQGLKKVVDCFFDSDGEFYNIAILSKCQACGGITKHIYRNMASEYISGPRKAVYTNRRDLNGARSR